MVLSYSILQLNPNALVFEYTSAVTTQHYTKKSAAGTKPIRESSTSTAISRSSQQSCSPAVVSASSSSPGGRKTLTTVSSSDTITSATGETDDSSSVGVKVAQCHSASSEGVGRKRGRKRKKSRRCSSSPSPVRKRFCVRDDGPGIIKTFLSVKDRDGGPRSPQESPSAGSELSEQNPQSASVSCVETSIPFVTDSTKENMVQNLDPGDRSASKMIVSADQDSVGVDTCRSIYADISQSHTTPKDAVLNHQNCVVSDGTNDNIASDAVIEKISLSADRVELTLGLAKGTDFEGDIVGVKTVSSAKNDQTLEPSDAKIMASSSEREMISGLSSVSSVSDISSRPVSQNSDSINAVSSTIETKTINDSAKLGGSEVPHVLKSLPVTLPKDKTQFLEADSSMLPTTPCTSGIYGPPSCSQMVSGLCETAASDKFGVGQKDTVLCPQCGRKAGFVDGTSVTSTSSSIRCYNCLSFNTSITLFINHGQGRINPEERIEFSRGHVPYEEPQERTCVPEVPTLRINDPGGGSGGDGSGGGSSGGGSGGGSSGSGGVESGEDIRADLVPKIECLDDDHISTELNCGLRNHLDTATCSQRAHPSLSSSFSAVSTMTGRHCQPPADPNDLSGLQTKTTCQSGQQSILSSNAFPSRVIHPSAADSSPAAPGSAAAGAGSLGDRCPAVAAVTSAPLTGNKCGRKQKSLESIIRQLQPRQMSPVAVGAGSLKLSPKAPPSPSLNRKPVIHETPVKTPLTSKEQSIVEDPLVPRQNAEGQGRSLSTENTSLLRRALTISGRNFQAPTGRFPKPEERLHIAPSVNNQSPYSFTAPPIKKLKNMFDGLDSTGYASVSNGAVSRGENRRQLQGFPTTSTTALTMRDTRASGFNCVPALPEAAFQDNHLCVALTRRYPTVAVTSANGFDAPLELTTKESRDRKRRETAKKSDGDVLRTSFPLFDNKR